MAKTSVPASAKQKPLQVGLGLLGEYDFTTTRPTYLRLVHMTSLKLAHDRRH